MRLTGRFFLSRLRRERPEPRSGSYGAELSPTQDWSRCGRKRDGFSGVILPDQTCLLPCPDAIDTRKVQVDALGADQQMVLSWILENQGILGRCSTESHGEAGVVVAHLAV